MKKCLSITQEQIGEIKNFSIKDMSREINQLTDSLSKLAFGGVRLREVQLVERSLHSFVETIMMSLTSKNESVG